MTSSIKIKSLLALLCLLLLFTVALAESVETNETGFSHSGTLSLDKGGKKLLFTSDSDSNSTYTLLLAPAAALDSLGITAQMLNGKVKLNAKISGSAMIVQSIQLENKQIYTLRDTEYKPLWTEASTFSVNSRACISCRLCVSKCPVAAISMVNGKAVIDKSICSECGICIDGIDKFRGCPVDAIKP